MTGTKSAILGVVFEKIPGTHDDDRRTLTPIFNMDVPGFKGAEQMKVAAMKRDGVLGSHHHHYAELFTVLSGKAVFELTDTGATFISEEHILVPGWRLLIPSYVYHSAKVDAGTILLGLTE